MRTLLVPLLNWLTRKAPKKAVAGIHLGTAVGPDRLPAVWPDRYRREHLVLTGKTGVGKTYLVERIAVEIASRGEGFALLDFHGDASMSLMGRLIDLGLEERLIVLDPSHPSLSPGMNILEASDDDADRFRRVSEISSVLRQRWGVDSFGARTEELLRNSLFTLAANSETLTTLPRLLTDAAFRTALTGQITHVEIGDYWTERYEPLSDGMKSAFREPLLNKITAFLSEPGARHLLAQQVSTIDLSAIMREQKCLIIRLSKGRLREHAHTIGNLVFAQLQFAAIKALG